MELPTHVDLYREVHKGLRAMLFSATEQVGRVNVADDQDVSASAEAARGAMHLLDRHAFHEDNHIDPMIEAHAPGLVGAIRDAHAESHRRGNIVLGLADQLVAAAPEGRESIAQELYMALADFTAQYLEHLAFEEGAIMPALAAAVPVPELLQVQMAVRAAIPPPEMVTFLGWMLPAMNLRERTALLGGMKANAPAEVFEALWGLASRRLSADDLAAVSAGIGV